MCFYIDFERKGGAVMGLVPGTLNHLVVQSSDVAQVVEGGLPVV